MTSPTPVLLVTHDDALWQHWSRLDPARWMPARGRTLEMLQRWPSPGRSLAVLDADLPAPELRDWKHPYWGALLPGLRLIVASSRPEDEEGTQVLSAGAHGYCHAYIARHALEQVLEVAAAGGIWMGRSLVARLLRLVVQQQPPQGAWDKLLTARESSVARRAAIGQSNVEIAAALGITERTVKAHLSAVFAKLGVADRLQLALLVHGIGQRDAA